MRLARICPALLLLFFLSPSLGFADSAPPMKPIVQLNITLNGQPYSGEANATYICSGAANTTGGSIALLCQNGSCNNGAGYGYEAGEWFGLGAPCFYSKGWFVVEAEGRNTTSGEVSLERGGDYEFVFDIGTGMISASDSNPPPGPEPVNQCCPAMILLGSALAVTFVYRTHVQ